MKPFERVRNALNGEPTDRIPFTVYWLMFPRGRTERLLRNRGVTVIERVPLYRIEYTHVEILTREYHENGRLYRRREYKTPKGNVSSLFTMESANNTSWWQREYFIKTPDDYRVIEFIFKDMVYRENFIDFSLAVKRWDGDGYVMGNTEYSPMNMLIYDILGLERFSIDLADNEDSLLSLYDLIRKKQHDMFGLCAKSPAKVINYCGNISQEICGISRFEQYYLPCLNEFADVMHEAGKLASCHYDAKMSSLTNSVALSGTDIIEAFTPFPTGDLSVGQARQAWKDKILWINFPSSLHIEPAEIIEEELGKIIREAGSANRFLIGITEDVPENFRSTSFKIINEGLINKSKAGSMKS